MSLSNREELRLLKMPPEKPTFLSAPEHPCLAEFATYLDGKRGLRPFADRANINPAEILPLLPHIIILDLVDGGEDFRVRVFGTALVELVHEERTGQLVSRFGEKPTIPTDPKELRTRWLTICKLTQQNKKSLFFKAPTVSPERAFMVYHGLFAPLSAGTQEIDQIIGVMMTVGLH